MARIRPMGQCEECPPEEGLKQIVSHGLCAKHNQQRLRAIWRKPEPSETQKQKLMEKLEKDLIGIKNMCSKWERDGYVAMKLVTPETIETLRAELGDYLDFRPTLKAAPPKNELEEALAGQKAPPPMFADEDAATAAKKSVSGQYQFAPVIEKPAAEETVASAPEQEKEPKNIAGENGPKTTDDSGDKADHSGSGAPKASAGGKPPRHATDGATKESKKKSRLNR
jgi:hypothetical protein